MFIPQQEIETVQQYQQQRRVVYIYSNWGTAVQTPAISSTTGSTISFQGRVQFQLCSYLIAQSVSGPQRKHAIILDFT